MPLNCVIVDDEPRAHVVLKHYIARLPYLRLGGSFGNVIEAHNYLEDNVADIIFLDIRMPEFDGFTLLEMVDTNAAVIITTAYTNYAFKSYEYNAVDYLHKPIRFERFQAAIEKVCKRRDFEPVSTGKDTVVIKVEGRNLQLPVADIIFAESLGNYVKIHCSRTSYLTLMTTKELKEKLDCGVFARIHKSYIVNLSKITALEKEVIAIGTHRIPVGKTYKIFFEAQLQAYRKRNAVA